MLAEHIASIAMIVSVFNKPRKVYGSAFAVHSDDICNIVGH